MFIVPLTPMATQLDQVTGTFSDFNKNEPTTAVGEIKSEVKSFADYLKDSIQNVRDLEAESDRSAYDLAMGKTENLEEVMLLSAKASTAVEATVQITTRAVNAYKEVMQMQI